MTVMRDDRPVALDSELAKKLKRAAVMQDRWLQDRDQLIVEAHDAGGSLREIGALAGLSHVGVMKIVSRYRAVEVDHIVPLSEGGSADDPDNLQLLTAEENRRKGRKRP